jgi:hypothetical protein
VIRSIGKANKWRKTNGPKTQMRQCETESAAKPLERELFVIPVLHPNKLTGDTCLCSSRN